MLKAGDYRIDIAYRDVAFIVYGYRQIHLSAIMINDKYLLNNIIQNLRNIYKIVIEGALKIFCIFFFGGGGNLFPCVSTYVRT